MEYKRLADLIIILFLLAFMVIPLLIIALLIKISSRGPIIYWSNRVGQNNQIFKMPKFRTMYSGAPAVATHLLKDPENYITPLGKVLRDFSLDELPQFWCIIKGHMSLIGPRPALHNQHDLIKLRTENGIQKIKPGITGWAQINGRDDLSINEKVKFDIYYLKNQNYFLDVKIIFLTFKKVIFRDNIKH